MSCKKLLFGCWAAMAGRSSFTCPLISFLIFISNVSILNKVSNINTISIESELN